MIDMVLDDVIEYEMVKGKKQKNSFDSILLNGKNVCIVRFFCFINFLIFLKLIPGGEPDNGDEDESEN